jgi:hypothetical protein
MKTACMLPLVLPTAGIIQIKLHQSVILFIHRPALLCIVIQKAATLDTAVQLGRLWQNSE